MNNCNFIGRVGRDAVVRHTQGGKAVTGWSLAVDRGWGDNKQTTWMDCTIWGERGEKLAEHIRKGDRLGVTGELGTREHDGKTYVTLDVRDVTLLGGKPDTGNGTPRQSAPRATERPAPATAPPADDGFIDDSIPFISQRGGW